VNQDIKSIGDTAVRNWTVIRTKIAADIDTLKAGAARAKHDLDARHAESHTERLWREAGIASNKFAPSHLQSSRFKIDVEN
jgi:hypothetical protein